MLGKALLDISIDIFELCRQFKIPFMWEASLPAFMRKMKRSVAVSRWPGVVDVEVHYCGYEQPWKNRPGFAATLFLVPRNFWRGCAVATLASTVVERM